MRWSGTRAESFLRLAKLFTGFVGIGAVNTILSIALFEVLILFLPYWIAYWIPFPLGIAFLLYANATFVFGRGVKTASAVLFVLVYLANYAIGYTLIIVMVEGIGVPPAYAPFAVLAIMTPINFIGSRLALER
jgi:putative flippase GtrA